MRETSHESLQISASTSQPSTHRFSFSNTSLHMYAAYRCLSEATGVELSTKAKLEKSDREFLVTSCGTCLRLYEVEKETTLRSIAVHDLYGRITGIHAIPSGSGGVDVLVLVFGLRVSLSLSWLRSPLRLERLLSSSAWIESISQLT